MCCIYALSLLVLMLVRSVRGMWCNLGKAILLWVNALCSAGVLKLRAKVKARMHPHFIQVF